MGHGKRGADAHDRNLRKGSTDHPAGSQGRAVIVSCL